MKKKFQNPTRAEKAVYREKLERGTGLDLEPKSSFEINKDRGSKPYIERYEERRLDGSNLDHYRSYDKGLGDPAIHDDYSEDSRP